MSLAALYQQIDQLAWVDIPEGWLQGRTIYGGLVAAMLMHKAAAAEQPDFGGWFRFDLARYENRAMNTADLMAAFDMLAARRAADVPRHGARQLFKLAFDLRASAAEQPA